MGMLLCEDRRETDRVGGQGEEEENWEEVLILLEKKPG